jgi:hypothetical protein
MFSPCFIPLKKSIVEALSITGAEEIFDWAFHSVLIFVKNCHPGQQVI